ncbi:MAG: hypothetical protein KA768_02835 [Desulfobulbus sp.]|nr:hypothetical protein [Desulfobulbus sp.]
MPYSRNLNLRFESSISQVNELLAVHSYLQSAPVVRVADNVLRAALSMMVSTIDTSVHEIVVNSIIFELKEGKSAFSLDKVKVGIMVFKEPDDDERIRLIESDIRRQLAKESFQSSRQIESSLAQIGITKIWTKLSVLTGMTPEDIKIRLDLLVRRRNQIVHEGDLDHLHSLRDIERDVVDDSLKFTRLMINGMIDEFSKIISA